MYKVDVWIRKRIGKRGPTYAVRWVEPDTHRYRSQACGRNKRNALDFAAKKRRELEAGARTGIRAITWRDFAADHVDKIAGAKHTTEAERTLTEFGEVCKPAAPRAVTYAMLETYVAHLRRPAPAGRERVRRNGNSVATINKKLRYLRGAFNAAVQRRFLAVSPMLHWRFEREDDKALRILGDADEVALLNAAEEWYGDQWRAFVFVALRTGGRRSELLRLTWDRVHLDGDEPRVHFANTKGKRDRFVPITPDTVAVLQRLKARTLPDGGPFVALGEHIDKQWRFIVGKAGIKAATLHDLRRTYVTRLVRAGVPLPHVQKLAGHASIQTTLTHYNQVDDADLRAGIEKLRKAAGA